MKRKLLYIIILVFLAFSFNTMASESQNDTIKSTTAKGKKKPFKKLKAYFRYRDADYNGAIRIYREIYEIDRNDAKLDFLIGKCEVALQNMDQAILFLQNAKKLNPNVDKSLHFLLGEAYQYLGELDGAILEYNIYKSTLKPSRIKNDPVKDLLNQVETAKNLMAHPANVKIKNLGHDINSEYDDGAPQITADGKTLYFTSRRPDTKGGGIDPNTGQYYDDIYSSTWNDEVNKWNPALNVDELNTPGHDAVLGISSDGNTIFVYRNVPKVTGSGDIYFSTKKADGKWQTPKPLPKPINSSFFEGSCSISPDGNYIYFVSERNGGYGNGDIWRSKRIGKNLWEKPVNLGPTINTEGDEMSVFMYPDGKTLFFSSNGHNTMGGYDIFMSQMKPDSTWTEPINLGYPINTTKDEKTFTMTADGKKAYITSNKDNGLGGYDIYEVDMSKYVYPMKIEGQEHENNAAKVETDLSILKGSVIESSAAQQVEAEILIRDVLTSATTKLYTNETGDYFMTLKGGRDYEIMVDKAGYKKYSETISLPLDKEKTATLVKLIILEKLPENQNK
jgi:Tol biopolymer transport system component